MICSHCHDESDSEMLILVGVNRICPACLTDLRPLVSSKRPAGAAASPERVAEVAAFVRTHGRKALADAASKSLKARVAAGPLKRHNVNRTIAETEAANGAYWEEKCHATS